MKLAGSNSELGDFGTVTPNVMSYCGTKQRKRKLIERLNGEHKWIPLIKNNNASDATRATKDAVKNARPLDRTITTNPTWEIQASEDHPNAKPKPAKEDRS